MKRENVEDIYELSPLQEGMLFHTLYEPEAGMYFDQTGFPLAGPLDTQLLERAWQKVVDRHPILRTSFHWGELKKPLQVVNRNVKLSIEHLDWSGGSAGNGSTRQLESFLEADRKRGFELSQAPLLRLTVITLGPGSLYFVLSVHHILLDGWSSDLIFNEALLLFEAYSRGEDLQLPLSRPFGDYIAWLQSQDISKAEAYWRKRLKGYQAESQLSTAIVPFRTSAESEDFASYELRIPGNTSAALSQVARQHKLTLNTIVQGAWALLLSRYTGEADIAFGAVVSGRPESLEGVESMVGLFINTQPVRVRVPRHAQLLPWLRELQVTQAEAREFEHAPLVQIQSWCELPQMRRLFDTILGFANFPTGTRAQSRGVPSEFRSFGRTNYPLSLIVSPGNELLLRALYARESFETDAIVRLFAHFQELLTAIAENPAGRLGELLMLTATERTQLSNLNQTERIYPRERTIPQLFEEQVALRPDAIAATFEDEKLTYQQLNRRSNQLAAHLHARLTGPQPIVAISVESPIDLVTGMLGVLKCGGAYLPIDPSYPEERKLFMLRDSGAEMIVTADVGATWLDNITAVSLNQLNDSSLDSVGNPSTAARPEDIAYVMYTSGSTGEPKGVQVSHRAVIRTVRDTNYITIAPSQGIAQISNFCFDAATFEIWGALLNGGRLAAITKNVALSPDDFVQALSANQVNSIFVTTDLFNQLVRVRPDAFEMLEDVLVGGSMIDRKWIAACFRAGRPRRLVHVYGPTESTTFASWYLIDHIDENAVTIPIGSPLANTQLHILDREMNPLPVGVAGEIYIGGDGLAIGYHGRGDKTAARFVPNPFGRRPGSRLYRTGDRAVRRADGAIEFLGRFDDQVKIRGFRVEIGEVETVLRKCAGVADAVVLAREDAPGTKRLAAYVVPQSGKLSVADLRKFLERKLPTYMIPSAIVIRDALPLTPNGKVDRKLLAASEDRTTEDAVYTAPRTPNEETLANIWKEVLAVDRVGIHDNFFELGGDSIISIQIVARARAAGLNFTLRQLFQGPTVAELAAVAGTEASARTEGGTLTGEVLLTPIQQWFFDQQLLGAHHFNQASLVEAPAGINPVWLEQATAHLVRHHDALRLRFRRTDGRWRAFYDAPGQAVFQIVDLSDAMTADLSTRIESTAAELQRSLNLESGPLLRIAWINAGERPGRLLFVVHHLAIDTVSWHALMEDFWSAYGCLARGEEVELPPKTSSFRQWTSRLHQHAQSAEVLEDLAYWTETVSAGAGTLPLDFAGSENLVLTARTVDVELDEESTHELLYETPKTFQTVDDILLTAVTQVLASWTGAESVRFDLERHGREPLFDDIDLSRTTGWFTSLFPVRLELTSGQPLEALKFVKEQLRRIPSRGQTFGFLRYLTADEDVNRRLTAAAPEVAFNYLGHLPEAQRLESLGPDRSLISRRPHLIEINAAITGKRLKVEWEYSTLHHRRATIERVAARMIELVRDIAVECRTSQQAGFTPSDFAQAGISQTELDKLVAAVARSESPAK